MIKVGDLVKFRLDDYLIGLTISVKFDVVYVMWLNHPDQNTNPLPYNIDSLKKVS
jgi:hypothetical protein